MVKGLQQRLAAENHVCVSDSARIHALLDEAIRHTHDLAHQFSSLDVRGDELPAVLEGLAANVKKMFEIPCILQVKGTVPDLPPNTTLQLHKIAQEAVSNAIKHGKATHVSISLVKSSDQLVLSITNDGAPFAVPANARNRMGLRIMNYRARTIGASLEIERLRTGGTVVTCAMPLKNSSKPSRRARPPPSRPESRPAAPWNQLPPWGRGTTRNRRDANDE